MPSSASKKKTKSTTSTTTCFGYPPLSPTPRSLPSLSLSSRCSHSALYSFPTRRSSDLDIRPHERNDTHRHDFGPSGLAVSSGLVDSASRADAARGCMKTQPSRSEEHTSELQSRQYLVCRLLLQKKKRRAQRLRRRASATLRCRRPRDPSRVSVCPRAAATLLYTLSLHDALPILISVHTNATIPIDMISALLAWLCLPAWLIALAVRMRREGA